MITERLPVEQLLRRLRRMRSQAPEPDGFDYRPSSRSAQELQERLRLLDQRVIDLERRVSGPLWSLISVLVALALGAAGGKLI